MDAACPAKHAPLLELEGADGRGEEGEGDRGGGMGEGGGGELRFVDGGEEGKAGWKA